jgi:hypothetical protein
MDFKYRMSSKDQFDRNDVSSNNSVASPRPRMPPLAQTLPRCGTEEEDASGNTDPKHFQILILMNVAAVSVGGSAIKRFHNA